MQRQSIEFVVNVKFEGMKEKEQSPPTWVYAFDSTGRSLASAAVEKGQARLHLPAESAGRPVRLYLGPRAGAAKTVTPSQLSRLSAYERRLRVDPEHLVADLTVVEPVWRPWFICSCLVRGRLVKRFTLPDGTVKELPICNARVTICEVDSIPRIILRLPDDILWRLREELILAVRRPFPPPPPPPPPWEVSIGPVVPGPFPGLQPVASPAAPPQMRGVPTPERAPAQAAQPMQMQFAGAGPQDRVWAVASTTSLVELRQGLVALADMIRPYICGWPWLDPFFRYTVDCIATVPVDENGRFETTIYYPCFGDKPDLYFEAEQLQGGVWESIYAPPVRCNTHWNYECGTEVVINVTDPSAIPCAPADPVDTPPGVTTWVMPYAVGGTKIWGTPPGAPAAPAGWVRSDGQTDYAGIVNAPFGGYLGFRHGYSSDIPNSIKYFRWSYRKGAAGAWKHMAEPVYRHYVKQRPANLPTFPAYLLGPHTIGASDHMFEFKPSSPPGADPGDPPGTFTYWPTDDFFGDIYTAFLNTVALLPNVAGAAGQYEVKLEVFGSAGSQVSPGAGTFRFIVPTGVDSDGVTILAREAEAAELDGDGFAFNLHVDNNPCTAGIDAPTIGGAAVADVCGFLRYDPASATPVTIAFHAQHPNNFAEFNFVIVRGATYLAAASAADQEVAAVAAGPYAGDGAGSFTNGFPREDLLGACVNAAFAEDLYVFAKATTGWGTRISSYDASALRAFALAPEEA